MIPRMYQYENQDDFHWEKTKKFFFKPNDQKPKKCHFPALPILKHRLRTWLLILTLAIVYFVSVLETS